MLFFDAKLNVIVRSYIYIYMNSINKIHGTVIHDARISEESAEAISELTKDDVEALRLGQKNVYLKVAEDNLKTFLEKATFKTRGAGPYIYYTIADLADYTLEFADAPIDMGFVGKLALYAMPENREFEFENNGSKYKFRWSHEILFNFGAFEPVASITPPYAENEYSSDFHLYALNSISDYTNSQNLTEKVLRLRVNNGGGFGGYGEIDGSTKVTISSYKKYVIASGAATESDIDVKTPLFSTESPVGTILYNYTITKIEE